MSAVRKAPTTPDVATLDLWRVAETGDVRELAPVLARVRDINAQNEHGVTALMRAAQFGHVKMVRALLEHGADANIKRNDKFTALALAAFFGHTEIVRALMEHGADSQASTRHDTSPHMWATARTFNEVVDQLEMPAPVEKPPTEKPQPRTQTVTAAAFAPSSAATPAAISTVPVVRATVKTEMVRTLKDPPEIWDLVHEEPRGFNARSAFVTRLKSIRTGHAFLLAALAVLICAGVVGVMLFRGATARNERSSEANAKQAAPEMTNSHANAPQQNNAQPAAIDSASTVSALPPLPTVEGDVNAGEQPGAYRKAGARSRPGLHRAERSSSTPQVAEETVQPLAVAPAKPKLDVRADSRAKLKDSSALSPQMIAPAKTATPKAKVIQWP